VLAGGIAAICSLLVIKFAIQVVGLLTHVLEAPGLELWLIWISRSSRQVLVLFTRGEMAGWCRAGQVHERVQNLAAERQGLNFS
jgi:hypothetical protein